MIPVLYIERPVFYRQVAARYYSGVPYALQQLMCAVYRFVLHFFLLTDPGSLSLPLGLLDVILFSSIVYWVAGALSLRSWYRRVRLQAYSVMRGAFCSSRSCYT